MTPARLSTFALLASVVLLASSSGVSARRMKSSGDDDGDHWTSLGAVSCMDDDGENIETHRDIDSLADCEGKCDQSERCNAVTYNSDGKDCYLKAACHDQEMRNNNDESAVKGSEHGDGSSDSTASESEDSSESGDHDAGNWETLGDVSCMDDSGANEKTYRHIDSLADCEAKCEEHDDDCKAVTYNSDSKDCYLKTTCYDKEERDNGDESAQLKDVKFCWGKNGNAPKVFGVTHDHVCCVAAPPGEDGWECCQNDYGCDGSCYKLTTKDGYQKGEPAC